MRTRAPFGIAHLTVVPENYVPDETDGADTADVPGVDDPVDV